MKDGGIKALFAGIGKVEKEKKQIHPLDFDKKEEYRQETRGYRENTTVDTLKPTDRGYVGYTLTNNDIEIAKRIKKQKDEENLALANIKAVGTLSPDQIDLLNTSIDQAGQANRIMQLEKFKKKRNELMRIDEVKGGQFSPRGSGDFKKEILQDATTRSLYRQVFNDIKKRDLTPEEDANFEDTIQEMMSGLSVNITKGLLQAAKTETPAQAMKRKWATDIYRSSNLTGDQIVDGTQETLIDPATWIGAGVGAATTKATAKIAGKVLPKVVPELVGLATDGMLTGAAQSASDQASAIKAKEQDEFNTKEAVKAGAINTLFAGALNRVGSLFKKKKKTPEEVIQNKATQTETKLEKIDRESREEHNKQEQEKPKTRTIAEEVNSIDIPKQKDKEIYTQEQRKAMAEDTGRSVQKARELNVGSLLPETDTVIVPKDIQRPAHEQLNVHSTSRAAKNGINETVNRVVEKVVASDKQKSVREILNDVGEGLKIHETIRKESGSNLIEEKENKAKAKVEAIQGILANGDKVNLAKHDADWFRAELRAQQEKIQTKTTKAFEDKVAQLAKRKYGEQFAEEPLRQLETKPTKNYDNTNWKKADKMLGDIVKDTYAEFKDKVHDTGASGESSGAANSITVKKHNVDKIITAYEHLKQGKIDKQTFNDYVDERLSSIVNRDFVDGGTPQQVSKLIAEENTLREALGLKKKKWKLDQAQEEPRTDSQKVKFKSNDNSLGWNDELAKQKRQELSNVDFKNTEATSKLINEIREQGIGKEVAKRIVDDLKNERMKPKDIANVLYPMSKDKKYFTGITRKEAQAERLAKYIEWTNENASNRVLGEKPETGNVKVQNKTSIKDARFQVLQNAAVAMGEGSSLKVLTEGIDPRVKLGKELTSAFDDTKEPVKVFLRNYTYNQGLRKAAIELTKAAKEKLTLGQAMDLAKTIESKLEEHSMGAMKRYREELLKTSKLMEAKPHILKMPDGQSVKIDARDVKETKLKSGDKTILIKTSAAENRPGKLSAQIAFAMDQWLMKKVTSKMPGFNGATIFDGISMATEKDVNKAIKIATNAMRELDEAGGINYLLRQLNPRHKDVYRGKINWEEIDTNKLFDKELDKKTLDAEDLGIQKRSESGYIESPYNQILTILSKNDPTSKNGRQALKQSIKRFFQIKDRYTELGGKNIDRSKTTYTDLDNIIVEVAKANTTEELHASGKSILNNRRGDVVRAWSQKRAKLMTELRYRLEQNPLWQGKRLVVEKNGELKLDMSKSYAEIYNEIQQKNFRDILEELGAETIEIDKKTMNAVDVIVKKLENKEEPPALTTAKTEPIVATIRNVEAIEKTKQKPIRMNNLPDLVLEQPKTGKERKQTFKELLGTKRITKADGVIMGNNTAKTLKTLFKNEGINPEDFTKYVLDTAYRHIQSMSKEEVQKTKAIYKRLYERLEKQIKAAAKASNNNGNKYGYFVRNAEQMAYDAGIPQEHLARAANAIRVMIAGEAMTKEAWDFVQKHKNSKSMEFAMNALNHSHNVSKEILFNKNIELFHDNYLAEVTDMNMKNNGEIDWRQGDHEGLIPLEKEQKRIGSEEVKLTSKPEELSELEWMDKEKLIKQKGKYFRVQSNEEIAGRRLSRNAADIIAQTISSTHTKVAQRDFVNTLEQHAKEEGSIISFEKQNGMVELDKKITLKMPRGLKGKKIYIDKALHDEILGRSRVKVFGETKFDRILKELTHLMKYNAVATNISSIVNAFGYTITAMGVVSGHPRMIGYMAEGYKSITELEKLQEKMTRAMLKNEDVEAKALQTQISENKFYQLMKKGLAANQIDGVSTQRMLAESAISDYRIESTSKKIVANILQRPHSATGEALLKAFSLGDSIGRYAAARHYEEHGGFKGDIAGAAQRANRVFADMSEIGPRWLETIDAYPWGIFTKWIWQTSKGMAETFNERPATLARAIVIMAGLKAIQESQDVNTDGWDPLTTILDAPEQFIVDPIRVPILKYTGNHPYEQFARSITSAILPGHYNKTLWKIYQNPQYAMNLNTYLSIVLPQSKANWGPESKVKRKDGTNIMEYDMRGTVSALMGINPKDRTNDRTRKDQY